MENKKIVEEIAKQLFTNSKELKNHATTIKKTINSIKRQQSNLAKYLSSAEVATLTKAINILEPYILIYNAAAKESAQISDKKTADWEKQKIERLENMVIEDFGSFSTDNLIKESKLLIAFLEENHEYVNSIKDALNYYEKNPTPGYLSSLKKRLADQLDDFSLLKKELLLAFKHFKIKRK